MVPSDFNEGDDFYTPRISGYEILLDTITEDMEANPTDYNPLEVAFILNVPQNAYPDYWKDVRAFIDNWCDARTPEPDYA